MSSQQRRDRGMRSYTLPNNDSNHRKREKSRNRTSRSKAHKRTEKYAKHSAHPKLQLSNRSHSRTRKTVESHRKEKGKAPAFRLVANQNMNHRKEALVPPLVTNLSSFHNRNRTQSDSRRPALKPSTFPNQEHSSRGTLFPIDNSSVSKKLMKEPPDRKSRGNGNGNSNSRARTRPKSKTKSRRHGHDGGRIANEHNNGKIAVSAPTATRKLQSTPKLQPRRIKINGVESIDDDLNQFGHQSSSPLTPPTTLSAPRFRVVHSAETPQKRPHSTRPRSQSSATSLSRPSLSVHHSADYDPESRPTLRSSASRSRSNSSHRSSRRNNSLRHDSPRHSQHRHHLQIRPTYMEPHSLEAIHRGKALVFPELALKSLPSKPMNKPNTKPNAKTLKSKTTTKPTLRSDEGTGTTMTMKSKPKMVPNTVSKVVVNQNGKSSRRSAPKMKAVPRSAPKPSKVSHSNSSKKKANHRFSADSKSYANSKVNSKTKHNRNSADSLSPLPSASSLAYFNSTDSAPPLWRLKLSASSSRTPAPTMVFPVPSDTAMPTDGMTAPDYGASLETTDDMKHSISMDSGDSVDSLPHAVSPKFAKYLVHRRQRNDVHFDRGVETVTNGMKCLVSSKALTKGIHEWEVEVRKSDVEIQEIGVVGTADIERVAFSKKGCVDTHGLGTRIVYGSEMATGKVYYASLGGRGSQKKKVYKDLTQSHHIGWVNGNVIKVRVNLDKWAIRFWLNGNKVGKQMHLERNRAYYPVIAFAGNCQYTVR